ncbi:hypothetical protein ABZ780_22105 [Micromonospora sp. NPDC047467]|uniref:hypothetical protein n=1 Tax=Micromonospora sp. NPDC047467 TaxID=3154814 RepID=UPI0033FAF6A3
MIHDKQKIGLDAADRGASEDRLLRTEVDFPPAAIAEEFASIGHDHIVGKWQSRLIFVDDTLTAVLLARIAAHADSWNALTRDRAAEPLQTLDRLRIAPDVNLSLVARCLLDLSTSNTALPYSGPGPFRVGKPVRIVGSIQATQRADDDILLRVADVSGRSLIRVRRASDWGWTPADLRARTVVAAGLTYRSRFRQLLAAALMLVEHPAEP